MDWVNTSSIVLTVLGLCLSLWMSRSFLSNFYYSFIAPLFASKTEAVTLKEKVSEGEQGDFLKEMWKLGTLMLAFCQVFDLISSWTFFAKVVVLDSTEADLTISGQR